MAQRDDISIDWHLSPRIVRIAAPSTEVIIQDLHDTVREIEQRIENLIYDQAITTAGKEELGGGVTVGLTATLLNAKVSFDARKTSVSNGSVTAGDSSGITLTDTAVNFLTDGVQPGGWVVNLTDGSTCSVISVLSSNQILTDQLADGYDNEFEIGDLYKIWNVEQCNIQGGNLVALDGYSSEISPVLTSMGTQIVRASSSSATLQELQDIQHSSFNNYITLDPALTSSGTNFPYGTGRLPVNNIQNAITIAQTRGISTILLKSNYTLTGVDVSNHAFLGLNHEVLLTVDASANTENCGFTNLMIEGTFSGSAHVRDCYCNNLYNIHGHLTNCSLSGEVVLSGDGYMQIINCWDETPGFTTPIINCNGGGTGLIIRGYNGGLIINNKTDSDDISIDMNSARIILENTVTNGTIIIRGVGHVTNNSTGNAIVDSSNVVNPGTVSTATLKKTLPFLP